MRLRFAVSHRYLFTPEELKEIAAARVVVRTADAFVRHTVAGDHERAAWMAAWGGNTLRVIQNTPASEFAK